MAENKEITTKDKSTGTTYTKRVIQGTPGLRAAKIVADAPKDKKEKKDKKESKVKAFMPFPSRYSIQFPKRSEKGGKLTRLKRK